MTSRTLLINIFYSMNPFDKTPENTDTKSETQANGGDDTKEQATPALIPDYGIIVQHWDSSRKFRENSYIRFLRVCFTDCILTIRLLI